MAAANSVSAWYHEGSSLSDSGMIERAVFGDKGSDEGSLDRVPGDCKGSVGESWMGG